MLTTKDEMLDMLFNRTDKETPTVPNIRETAETQLQELELERQRLLNRLAMLDQFGAEDPWEDGTVLIFERTFNGRRYTYVTVKTSGVWYVTGALNNRPFPWPKLVEEHLARAIPESLYVVSQWVAYS